MIYNSDSLDFNLYSMYIQECQYICNAKRQWFESYKQYSPDHTKCSHHTFSNMLEFYNWVMLLNLVHTGNL